MSGGVSVVICCHNSAKRLPETLRHLAAQQVSRETPWEVLLIDNASTDDTAETARRCWPANAPAPLRIVAEPRPGTGNARFRSFSEARYEIISFLDDDNWIVPHWLSLVVDFFHDHPEAAVVGGPSTAVFEISAPPWFSGVAIFHAVGEQHPYSGEITHQPGTLLWTAGMSLRRQDALDLINQGFTFLTCVNSSFARGEDTELCLALRAAGKRLFYDERLAIQHYMPAERLLWPKTVGLMRVIGASSTIIDLYLMALNAPPFDTAPVWKKNWLFQALKTLRRLASMILSHPRDCYFQTEGSPSALHFQKTLGHLSTLWTLCGRFQNLVKSLRGAAWNKGGRRTGT